MKGQEFKNLRQQLGLDRLEFARLLGYTGTDRNDVTRIRQYEGSHGSKQVPLYIARFVWLCVDHKLRTGLLPLFPIWEGYEYDHNPDQRHKGADDAAKFY